MLLVVAPRRFWPIILCAYLIRATLCFVHSYALILPDSQFDAIRFESTAWLWAQDARCIDDFTTGSLLYSWIGSCVYVVAGRTAVLLQLINSFLGTAIVLVAMRTTQILIPHETRYRLVGWLLALHPTMLLYSAITMREVAIVLPFVLSMYCLVKWRVYKMYRYGASSIFWIMLSQMFHTGMIVGTMLVVSIVIYYTVADHWRRIARVRVALRDVNAVAGSVFVFALLVLAASIMSGTGHGLDKIQRLATEGVLEALSGWQIPGSARQGELLKRATTERVTRLSTAGAATYALLRDRAVRMDHLESKGCLGICRRELLVRVIIPDCS